MKNTNSTALIFRKHNILPIIFMTFLVNIINVTAEHNLFSWLQIIMRQIAVTLESEQNMSR